MSDQKEINDTVPPAPEETMHEKIFKQNEEILRIAQKLERHMFWAQVWGLVKLLIIIVPLVIGLLFLPPLIRDILAPYQDLLQMGTNPQAAITDSLDIGALLKELKITPQ